MKIFRSLLASLMLLLPVVAPAQLLDTGSTGILSGGSAPLFGGAPVGGGGGSLGGTPGVWTDVTGSIPTSGGACDSYGLHSVEVDRINPAIVYVQADCFGIWKSTNYGLTFTGPINTGTRGVESQGCAGGFVMASNNKFYQGCLRGTATGFMSSTDGINWLHPTITGTPSGQQDIYEPVVDPYDPQHVLIYGHEFDWIGRTQDGGTTWANVPMVGGMQSGGGSAFMAFVDTGNSSTTRCTWLYQIQVTGGFYGTWRTSDCGTNWTKVSNLEHPHGTSQFYQAGPGGAIFMGGQYASGGNGMLRSTDLGQTWTNVGANTEQSMVCATASRIYGGYGWAIGTGFVDNRMQSAALPGITGWSTVTTPGGMNNGGVARCAHITDGTQHGIVVSAWRGGVWRYVEP